MRRLPAALSAVFLAITLARVAQFSAEYMQAGALGWLFAVGLGVATFATAYWTRTATTRRAALVGLMFFVAADAYFNAADVWLSADTSTPLLRTGALIYGLFPTVAVALLGWLQSRIASLPPVRRPAGQSAHLSQRLADWAASLIPDAQPETQATAETPQVPVEPAQPPQKSLFVCVTCGKAYAKQTSLAAHMRAHAEKKRNGHAKEPAK